MAHDRKQKKKIDRNNKQRMHKHHKIVHKADGLTREQVQKGRWLLYLLGALIVASSVYIFLNMN